MNRSRTRACLIAILAAAGIIVTWPVVTSAATPPTTTGSILFADDFTGPAGAAPDASKWQDYSACAYNPSAAFGLITCGNNEKLDGAGHLIVPATPKAGSAIRTGSLFNFQYGTMSAWIKLPSQAGYWPAFWSLNSPANGSSALPVGEVDAMEGYTTWLNAYHATVHNYGANGAIYSTGDNVCPAAQNVNLSTAFHKYSASIEPGRITFFFDDVLCGTVATPAAGKTWAFGPDVSRGNWMILDLAVGGAGGQQKTPTANAQMLVDRVEVRTTASPVTAPTTPTPAPTPAPAPGAASAPTPLPLTARTPALTSGAVYRLVNSCGNMVLAVPSSSAKVSGAPLRTAVWKGSKGQRWRVVSVGSGYYKLVNVTSGKVANVAYASMSNGAAIIQYADVSGPNEQWKITASGQIISRQSGKAIEVEDASSAAGAAIDQSTPVAGCAESWSFIPA